MRTGAILAKRPMPEISTRRLTIKPLDLNSSGIQSLIGWYRLKKRLVNDVTTADAERGSDEGSSQAPLAKRKRDGVQRLPLLTYEATLAY